MAGIIMPPLSTSPGADHSLETYLLHTRPARWRAAFSQALCLPRTLLRIRKLVAHDCSPEVLDHNLQSFRAHQQGSPDAHRHARLWNKARLSEVSARDVVGLSVWEMVWMMNVAMEIEDPVFEYSRQNREGFSVLMPALARFMGDSHDPENLASWCQSPWCIEERRHGNTFARLIQRLTGIHPSRENPNRPMSVQSHRTDAHRLLTSRESAEWNSSSTYLVMAAHAAGHLHTLIRNIARDEIKHLAVLSSLDAYLLGHSPWKRFLRLIRQGLAEYRNHQRKRSAGQLMGTNAISSFEVVLCHLLIEASIRRWLNGLPAPNQ